MRKRWWALTGGVLVLAGTAVLVGRLRSGYPVPPAPAPANDAHGDPLPPFARARIGQVHHPRTGYQLAFDADSGQVVSLVSDGTVHFLDPETGEVRERIRLWERHVGELEPMNRGFRGMFADVSGNARQRTVSVPTLSPDGKRVAGAADRSVLVWDLPATDPALDHDAAGGGTNALAFSPDGTRLAIAHTNYGPGPGPSGEVLLLDLASGRATDRTAYPFPNGAALAADGSALAITGAAVHVVDLRSGALRVAAPKREFANRHVGLSPDGSLVASIENQDIGPETDVVVRDANTGDELWRASMGGGGYLRGLAFSPDGALLAVAGSGGGVHVAATGEVLFETNAVGFAFSPDGKRLFGSYASGLHVWTVGTWEVLLADPVSRDARGYATDFAFFRDGSRIVTTKSNTLSVWDARSGAHDFTIETGLKASHQVAISPDGTQALIGTWAGSRADVNPSCLVDLVSRTVVQRFDVRSGTLLAFVEGQAVTITADLSGRLEVVSVAGDGLARTLKTGGEAPAGQEISADGSTVAAMAGANRRIHVWDVATGELRPGFPVSEANHVALSATGEHVISFRGLPVRVHDARDADLRMEVTLRGTLASGIPIAISPDGRYVAIAAQTHFLELWDVNAEERMFRFEGHLGRVLRVRFSPDGRTLASSSQDGTLLLWDLSPWLDED